MSAEMTSQNVIEFPRPTLVSETPVYDLAVKRQEKAAFAEQSEDSIQGSCADGVCVLAWRPRKPQGDAA